MQDCDFFESVKTRVALEMNYDDPLRVVLERKIRRIKE